MSKEGRIEVIASAKGSSYNNPVSDIESSLEIKENGELQRGLKSRHIQLIALGGCIGTGLFIGSGAALSIGGPAALLTSYLIMSTVIYAVMNSLAEMTCYLPIRGASISTLADRYVDKSLAFAMGWNYWYSYNILVPTEITAAALVVEYWTDKVPTAAWITIFLIVIVGLNCLAVKYYGEAEFWFASLKIFCIVGLIIVGIVIFFGGAPTGDRLGFRYWRNPGAFKEHLTGGNTGKFLSVWSCVIKSAFAFIQGPELVSLAAGESERPRTNVPKAAKRFIWRIMAFYILGSLVIGCIVSSNNDRLLNASGAHGAAASPFVIGIQNAGIPTLNHIVNAVILTSAWSSGNSYLYASSRSLLGLATEGNAPKFFTKINKHGVPIAIIPCALFSCLAYLNVSSSGAEVFNWFSAIATVSGLVGWILIDICYIRFRKACQYHGVLDKLPFRTPFQPYASYYVIVLVSIICITNGYAVFFDFNAADFVAAYITLPVFFILYFGHKIYMRVTQGYTKWYYDVPDIDLFSGLEEIEAEDAAYPDRIPRNVFEKIWFWIA